jgi:hypothetical protein
MSRHAVRIAHDHYLPLERIDAPIHAARYKRWMMSESRGRGDEP